jgi:hypothetical protein
MPIFVDVFLYFKFVLIILLTSFIFLIFCILNNHFLFWWNYFNIVIFLLFDWVYSLPFFIDLPEFIESNFIYIFDFLEVQYFFHFLLFPTFFTYLLQIIASTTFHLFYYMRFIIIIFKSIIYYPYRYFIPIKFLYFNNFLLYIHLI